MAQFETGYVPPSNTTWSESKPVFATAASSTPVVLTDISQAAKEYAEAAGRFIEAREALSQAQNRWTGLMDQLAKHREQEGV